MSVEMGIRHRDTGVYEVVPVATLDTFYQVWLPACERLGLRFIPMFAGGALTTVPQEFIPQIVIEVDQLRAWAASESNCEYLVDRCEDILAAFGRTDPATCEYDFG